MNDEQRTLINAFNDGQLDEKESEAVAVLLAENAQARSYLKELVELDRLLRSAFDPVKQQAVPARFHALLKRKRRHVFSHYVVPAALAASLLLAVVLVIRQDSIDQQMQDALFQMRQEIASLKHQTLENTPSGKAASWVAPVGLARAEVTPLSTFRTKDNRFCREYEERLEDANGVEIRRGIACRTGKGHWPDLTRMPSGSAGSAADGESAGVSL
mgnify:FL=1|jgi:surface antigen